MLEKYLGEIQEGKKRRRIEKKGVSEGRKSEERGRKIFKEEKGVFRSQHERVCFLYFFLLFMLSSLVLIDSCCSRF